MHLLLARRISGSAVAHTEQYMYSVWFLDAAVILLSLHWLLIIVWIMRSTSGRKPKVPDGCLRKMSCRDRISLCFLWQPLFPKAHFLEELSWRNKRSSRWLEPLCCVSGPGMTSYSNLTSGFWSHTVSIRLVQDQNTVIKQVQVPDILETDSAVMMDNALMYELKE